MQSHPNPPEFQSEPFLWGVSTSGYQHEGGFNGPDQPHNNWSQWEHQGRVETTGQAAEFWSRYEDDFRRCQAMGLTAFRLSIEWARVQPTTHTQPGSAPSFDLAVLDAYGDRLAACRRYGLEPILTLHHFTHPAWLGTDAWLQPETVEAYLHYVQTTVTHINRRLCDHHQLPPIRWYITVNEPNILVANTYLKGEFPAQSWGVDPALLAYNHLLTAHIRAYNCIHDIYEAQSWPRPQVSFNTYCSDLYWSEKVIWDLLLVRQRQIAAPQVADYVRHQASEWETQLEQAKLPFERDLAYQVGRVVRWTANWLGDRLFSPDKISGLLTAVTTSPRPQVFDYLAIDYYDPFFAHSLRWPTFSDLEGHIPDFRGWVMSGITSKWWDWRYLPEGLYFFGQAYAQAFDGCPLLIAENGMALRRTADNRVAARRADALKRSEFLTSHLQQVQRLRQAGVPLLGYCHWSLTDNYEWGSYTPRFGLFPIDFAAGAERLGDDHLGDRPAETYARLIRDLAEGEVKKT